MSGVTETPNGDATQPQKPKAPGKKEVKILMLHGKSFSPYMLVRISYRRSSL